MYIFFSPKGGFQALGKLKCTKIKSYNKSYVVNLLALAGAAMGCSSVETAEVATGFSIFTSDSIFFGVGLITLCQFQNKSCSSYNSFIAVFLYHIRHLEIFERLKIVVVVVKNQQENVKRKFLGGFLPQKRKPVGQNYWKLRERF